MRPHPQFHRHLNPTLWQADRLKPIVRLKLFQAAVSFYKFLDVPGLLVTDIILTGSNAAFNYTKLSDIDVHLLVDIAHSTCPKMADNLFLTKKSLWGQTYDIAIHKLPVEFYVENIDDPVTANGIYSILHNKWLKQPKAIKPKLDDTSISQKYEAFASQIDDLLSHDPDIAMINDLLARLHRLRASGLESFGEYSTENLAYKSLRDAGLLQQLFDKRTEIRNKELSLR